MKGIGLQDLQDLKFMNVDTFSFMIGQDLQSEQLDFVKSLGLKKSNPLNVLDEGFRLIGQGYNLISDKSTDPEMFKYELRDTKKGILVPASAKFTKMLQTVTFMEHCESAETMMKSRMKHLNVNLSVDYKVCFSAKAGFSYESSSSSESTSQQKDHSFLLEQRVFQISMANFDECVFTEDFKKDVKKLPDSYKISDKNNR